MCFGLPNNCARASSWPGKASPSILQIKSDSTVPGRSVFVNHHIRQLVAGLGIIALLGWGLVLLSSHMQHQEGDADSKKADSADSEPVQRVVRLTDAKREAAGIRVQAVGNRPFQRL